MDQQIGTSGYGTLPMQAADATICSTDSTYAMSLAKKAAKHEGKIKAYVDFTEFNKNYEEYLKKNGVRGLSDESKDQSDSEDASSGDVKVVLQRQ